MSQFLLIHGAYHGAWCWNKVVPLLEAKGHRVKAIDLPGHGDDPTPVGQVTMAGYSDRVCETLKTLDEPVILVGHSMGGAVISQTAEKYLEGIALLVYLTAFLPQNGQALRAEYPENKTSLIQGKHIFSEDKKSMTLPENDLKSIFYGDCSDEDIAWAKTKLVPNALEPFMAPIHTTEAKFGAVPREYIACLQDRALVHAFQEAMYTATPCRRVHTLDTCHSPFFSAPDLLAETLDLAAGGR